MINELSISEIDQIISWLQEHYPYELIKKLELLKEEIIFYNKLQGQKYLDDLNHAEQLRKQGGWKTSPVRDAYWAEEKK